MAIGAVLAVGAAKKLSKKGRAKTKDKKAAKLDKKAARKDKKAGRKMARAEKAEAKGKTGKAAKLRAKADVKSAKGDMKREKASKKRAKSGELKAKVKAGKTVKGAIKKAAKAVAGKASKTVKDARKDVGQAKAKVKGAVKETKKRVKAVATAASGGTSMMKKGPAMAGKEKPIKKQKRTTASGSKIKEKLKDGTIKVKSTPSREAKKEGAKGRKFVMNTNQTSLNPEGGQTVSDPQQYKSRRAATKANDMDRAAREAAKEAAGQGVNLGSMSDGNSMMKKGTSMMRAGMKGPSMMNIQYGNQASGRNMSNYTRQSGRPGSMAPGMSLSKHMARNKMNPEK